MPYKTTQLLTPWVSNTEALEIQTGKKYFDKANIIPTNQGRLRDVSTFFSNPNPLQLETSWKNRLFPALRVSGALVANYIALQAVSFLIVNYSIQRSRRVLPNNLTSTLFQVAEFINKYTYKSASKVYHNKLWALAALTAICGIISLFKVWKAAPTQEYMASIQRENNLEQIENDKLALHCPPYYLPKYSTRNPEQVAGSQNIRPAMFYKKSDVEAVAVKVKQEAKESKRYAPSLFSSNDVDNQALNLLEEAQKAKDNKANPPAAGVIATDTTSSKGTAPTL